jgi:hypothetical protein
MTTAIPVPDRRRLLLSPDATFNGVDFAAVRPGRRVLIDVHFINQVRVEGTLARDRAPVTLTGGGYPPELTVRPLHEDDAWSTDASGRPVLHLTADTPDPGSRYILTVHSDRVDPGFRSAAVTFHGPGEGAMDCTVPPMTGPPSSGPTVPIDYLAKDFASFCQALSNFSAARYPLWVERSEADVGVMLMELLSAMADELSYLQDRVAAEATLDTATQRLSLVQHARLVDYEPARALAATTVMQLDVAEPLSGVVQCQGTSIEGETVDFAAGTGIPGLAAAALGPASAGPAPSLDPRWNRYADKAGLVPQLVPYVWDPGMRFLRPGATSMWITGHGHGFYPGQELLIDTAGVVSGDQPVREVVLLTEATQSTDPVRQQDVTLIHWADGLASGHDLTRTQVAGNLVPAMQGRITESVFMIPSDAGPGEVPGTPVRIATVRADHAGAPPHCLYTLAGAVAWWASPAPDGGPAQERPALALHAFTAVQASTAEGGGGTVTWQWVPRLLEAAGTARSFTLTPERFSAVRTTIVGDDLPPFYDYDGDGTTIRFGEGTFGRAPAPGTTFRARYLVGGGAGGNVRADTIVTAAPGKRASGLVWRCTNPFAVTGGVDAETRAQIRDRAPQQIKAGLLSITGPADYQAAALAFWPVQGAFPGMGPFPGGGASPAAGASAARGASSAEGAPPAGGAGAGWARQAVAAFRWTGSWHSALTVVDPIVAEPAATQLGNLGALAELLDAKRLAGSDSSVALARYRWLDLRITCRATPGQRRDEVVAAVLARLDPGQAAGGTTGFFGHDRWTFGQALETSALIAAIQSCPGVAGVSRIQYRERPGPPQWRTLRAALRIAPGEILRIDNDRDRPQRGLLFVTVEVAQ